MVRLTIIEQDLGVLQRGETLIQHCKFRQNKSTVTVSSATLTIYYPCEDGSDSVNLVEDDSEYTGEWNIPSDATYGEYTTEVSAEDEDGNTYLFQNFFIILPFTSLVSQVRSISGIKQSNDIDDRDIGRIVWNSILEANEEVQARIVDERVYPSCFCGSESTHFFVKEGHILENELDCDDYNITGFWMDCGEKIIADDLEVIDFDTGEVGVGEIQCCKLYVTYRIHSANFKESLFKKAVLYLASHEVILRFNELDKATLADLHSNSPIVLANPDRMFKKYKQIMNKIKYKFIDGC